MQDGDPLPSGVGRKFDKAFWEQESTPDSTSESEFEIANPPAKTIRFDGREVVLGTNDVTQITADEFWNQLSSLLNEKKHLTASNFVAKNADTAEQILWERWATDPDASQVRFIARIASRNIVSRASWNAMLESAKSNPVAARSYHSARSRFTKMLRSENPSKGEVEQLRIASQQVEQPLAMADAMHLMAVGELIAGRNAWAESLLLQAIELAQQNQDDVQVADLWLMIAMNSSRSGDQSTATATAWEKAVASHSNAHLASQRPVDIGFWVRADRQRPINTAWPEATKRALMEFAKPVGCRFSDHSPVDLVIWSAVGNAQLDDGEPQLALLDFKKAESFASGEDVTWLRIAQSECLAALGQTGAAAALLSEPLTSSKPVISAAANAALGSAKLQAGTFRQGAQLLNKALVDSSLEWPNRSKAEADLALAMLIIGETDQGLKSLHAAQRKFQIQGNTMSLLQSLENETRLLEHEGKMDAANGVRKRVLQIESTPST